MALAHSISILFFLLLCLLTNTATADRLRVATAANFKPALLELNADFEAHTGHRVVVSSASTGVLATQLMQGAPFDVFFAADQESPETVAKALSLPANQLFCYAMGQLVLVGSNVSLAGLQTPTVSLAIANPSTAPYGRAAMEVLARSEFEQGSARKLVRGNNAIQAYQFSYTGAVDAALVPRSLANNSEAVSIPTHWHQPITQFALVLRRNDAVDAYIDWLRSDTVQARLTDAGYLPCS